MKDRYKDDQQLKFAYENACDCHYFGMGSRDWNSCGISDDMRKIVWNRAFWDVAEPDNKYHDFDAPVYA